MKKVKILGISLLNSNQLADIGCRWAVLNVNDIVAICRTEEEALACDAGTHVQPLEHCSNEKISDYCSRNSLFFTRG
jgi:hypothetical protein